VSRYVPEAWHSCLRMVAREIQCSVHLEYLQRQSSKVLALAHSLMLRVKSTHIHTIVGYFLSFIIDAIESLGFHKKFEECERSLKS
jgi:hypothetical protein